VSRVLRVISRCRGDGAPAWPGFTLLSRTAIALPAVAFCFAWYFLGYPGVATQTGLFFTFVLLTSLFIFVLAWREAPGRMIVGAAGISALIMVRWAASTFTAEQAPVVVSVCLAFSAVYFLVYLGRPARGTGHPACPCGGSGNASCLPDVRLFSSGGCVGGRPPWAPAHLHLRERCLACWRWHCWTSAWRGFTWLPAWRCSRCCRSGPRENLTDALAALGAGGKSVVCRAAYGLSTAPRTAPARFGAVVVGTSYSRRWRCWLMIMVCAGWRCPIRQPSSGSGSSWSFSRSDWRGCSS